MSVNVKIHKFRAHSAFAKNVQESNSTPRAMTVNEEITSYSALFSVQKYCATIEEIVQDMRRLCPLHGLDSFFTAYAIYKKRISSIVDQENMILRKMNPIFTNPTYQTGEDLRNYHEEFLTAVSHMNLEKQSVYFNTITELMNKLPLDLDKFLVKYRKNGQVKQYLSTFEPQFREQIRKLDQDIRTILLPLEFEQLDFDRVFTLAERLRAINRGFEVTLMSAVKQRCGSDRSKNRPDYGPFPLSKDTDWNFTVITLIPILSNLPLFIEKANSLGTIIPNLTMSIEKLCLEIDALLPINDGFNDVRPTKKNVTDTEDKVDMILKKASGILNLTYKPDQTKVDKLEIVVNQFEETINQLKSQIEIAKQQTQQAQEEYNKQQIVKRFQRIRQASDEIQKKFENDKDAFLLYIINQLKSLVYVDISIDEPDPYRMFNYIYKQLCKQMDELKNKNANASGNDNETNNEVAGSKGNENANDISNNQNIVNSNSDDKEYKKSFVTLCSQLTNKEENEFENKTANELSSIVSKAFDDINAKNDKSDEVNATKDQDEDIDALKEDIKKLKYTLKAIEPFSQLTANLSILLDQNESAFLPSSDRFNDYLTCVTKMKEVVTQLDGDLMHKEIHSLVIKSAELFNTFAIALSSSSFAPEYADNQKSLAAILSENQNLNASLARLRILLEEKDSLLQAETRKLARLEKQFAKIYDESDKQKEKADVQQIIHSIELAESESDFF